MKKLFIILLTVIPSFRLSALETVSGQLGELLESSGQTGVSALTLTGTMDARDFKYLSENLPALESLDLGGVTITEYSDKKPLFGNYAYYEAGELPKFSLMGMPLKEVVLPSGLKKIGDGAFAGCKGLQSVTIPATVEAVGSYAFSDAEGLSAVAGGEGVQSVGDYAFSHCGALASIPGFGSVREIGAYAFLACGSLPAYAFSPSLETVGEGAFKDCRLPSADFGECGSLRVVGAWAFADNPALSSVKFPSSLASIGDGAFFYNSSLQTVEFPAGLSKVNDFAFMGGESVTEATLPAGVREIGAYAFADWSQIAAFVIPSSVESLGSWSFGGWYALTDLTSEALVPPSTEADVWAGVTKSEVQLIVPEASESAYRSADQWRDFFNSSSLDEVKDSRLRVECSGDIITLRCDLQIESAALYDLSGILLFRKQPKSGEAVFDLGGQGGRVYIVVCRLEDGKVEYLKIARH